MSFANWRHTVHIILIPFASNAKFKNEIRICPSCIGFPYRTYHEIIGGATFCCPNIGGAVFQRIVHYSVVDLLKTYCKLRIFYGCPNIGGASMLQATVFRSFVGMNIYGMITNIFICYTLYYATRDRQVLACQSVPLILGCCRHGQFHHCLFTLYHLQFVQQSKAHYTKGRFRA